MSTPTPLHVQTGDQQFTGNVEILGTLNGVNISEFLANLDKSIVKLNAIKAEIIATSVITAAKAQIGEGLQIGYGDLSDLPALGDMAFEDAVEAAKLGSTIISGGYILTALLDVNAIKAVSGFFESIFVTGRAELKELAMSGITSGTNTVKASYDETISTVASAWAVLKSLRIAATGTLRTSMEGKYSGDSACSLRIYKNGSATGTTRTCTTDYQTWTEEISVSEGDYIQVYGYTPDGASFAYVKNFALQITEKPGILPYLG